MITESSKNPDRLLELIKKDAETQTSGKLKIFLGMAAGVGKTFAMLQAARQSQQRGIDVVIGVVEHHGRKETAQLIEGLEVIPRKILKYRGVEIAELDLDAVMTRKPQLALIDELAHSNGPGSRHHKRYLDVLELLKAGIDVYTTLNVQHIESRVDSVQEITRVGVFETVPDVIIDRADEVVLIDLSPDELLRRLHEGRIYGEDCAPIAEENFFRKGNLTALREVALRVVTEKVDRELRDYKTLYGIEGVWKSGGRLMVAIFASPYSEILIRWTRRVADLLDVSWIGAYVESDQGYSVDEQKLLARNIAFVQQLGGEIVSTRDNDEVKGLLRLAQQNNVTQIIVGKSQRGFFRNLLRGGSVVNRLLRQSGNIDIYAVATNRALGRKYLKKSLLQHSSPVQFDEIGWTFIIVIATWLLAASLQSTIGYMAVGILFLISVCLSGLILSRVAVMSLAFIFALIHNYFFIPPLFTWTVSNPADFMLLMMFLIAASVIGHLTTRLASKERILRTREERTSRLYQLAKAINTSQSVQDIREKSRDQLEESLDTEVVFFLKSEIKDWTKSPQNTNVNDRAIASWVAENGRRAGFGTDTLSASHYTFIPITGPSGILGVIGIDATRLKKQLTIDQNIMIDAFINQIALGIERESYHDKVKELVVLEEAQKLYKNLFDCVSHELKTPLAAIKGSASALLDAATQKAPGAVDSLGSEILAGSERLERLVENLLDMSRIESGMIRPKSSLADVTDLVSTALRSQVDLAKNRTINIKIPKHLPPVICDPVLSNQAFSNIINNALRYTPSDSVVEIKAEISGRYIATSIRDFGSGLPKDRPEKVFEKFFRSDNKMSSGLGLGLSIAKGFIEAQGGKIHVENHPEGGAIFVVYLPRSEDA